MGRLYQSAQRIKDSVPILRWLYRKIRHSKSNEDYNSRIEAETRIYKDVENINDLPRIFHYWADTYVRPMLEEFGFSNPDQFFAKYLRESGAECGDECPVFISIGAGNCDTEVRIAKQIREAGMSNFIIECLDMNPYMLERGRNLAESEGLSTHIQPVEGDFNKWRAEKKYSGIMANQSLHHVLDLEHLFDAIRDALKPQALFITSDMIGRNGHQRWPEALEKVQQFWQELPTDYRYNRQLKRHEENYINWDCSTEGFEGIRAQDILQLLLERFHFNLFIGFANVVDIFVDRSFGPNFDADAEWDRNFIDRAHAFDERALKAGLITPTHMIAAMSLGASGQSSLFSRGISPEQSIRKPN